METSESVDNLVKLLKTNICVVEFVKVNGEKRQMSCTLDEKIVPPRQTDGKTKKINENNVAVWDIDKQDWRSFRKDNVISYNLRE